MSITTMGTLSLGGEVMTDKKNTNQTPIYSNLLFEEHNLEELSIKESSETETVEVEEFE